MGSCASYIKSMAWCGHWRQCLLLKVDKCSTQVQYLILYIHQQNQYPIQMQLPNWGASHNSCSCDRRRSTHGSVKSSLQRSLGRGVTPAKRLDVLGFSYTVLVEIWQSIATSDDFQRVLLIQKSSQQAAVWEANPALSELPIHRVSTSFLPPAF